MAIKALIDFSAAVNNVFKELEETGAISEDKLQDLMRLQELAEAEHQENLRRDEEIRSRLEISQTQTERILHKV